jgi:uncharacterized repeat protein (TIGR02543 family)
LTITGATNDARVLAINPRTGDAFLADDVVTDIQSKLYSLNLATGVASGIGGSNPLTIAADLSGLAYSPSGDLYATDTDGKLMSLNTSTGATTDIIDMRNKCGNLRPKGIAFDAAGTLFFIDQEGVVCSAKVDNFAATVARFTSTISASNNKAWVGAADSTITGGPIVITYGNLRVNFNSNGGPALTPGSSPFYSETVLASLGQSNSSITLPSATRSGYTFNGWFDAATGGTLIGLAGATYLPASNASIDMYAQWTQIPVTPTSAAPAAAASTLARTGFDTLPLQLAVVAMISLGLATILMVRRRDS